MPLIPLWRDFQCTRGLGAVNLQCTGIIGLTNLSVTVLPHFSEFALYSPRRFSFNPKWPPDEESTRCKRNIEMTPLCNIEVTLPRVLGPGRCRGGAAGDSRDYAGGVFAVYSAAGRVPP